jgi:S-methylmethionine-dependent homocysteine/selenocysteine methylase
MAVVDELERRVSAGEVIVLDGATSTELQARGVPMDVVTWSAIANLERPEVVQAIHEDYIRAGADVIIANTYSTSPASLEPAGLGDRVDEINRRAVEIALRARDAAADRPVAVAGSMSSFCTLGVEGFPVLRAHATSFQKQAAILAQAGVDLIALEMIDAPDYGPSAVEAALATGLPVWLGMSPVRSDSGALGTFEEPTGFEELVKAVIRPELSAVMVMHTKPEVVPEALDLLRGYTDRPLGVYAETGDWEVPNWVFTGLSPQEYLAAATGWVAKGAQLIGGCCGTGAGHVRALATGLPKHLSG